MALNLITATTITRDVHIETPTQQRYVVKDVEFTYLTEAEFDELAKEKGDDVINDLIQGWGEFLDAGDKKIKYSKPVVKELMAERYAQVAFLTTYARAIMGADSKNFAASLALGQMSRVRAAKKQPNKKKAPKKNSKN